MTDRTRTAYAWSCLGMRVWLTKLIDPATILSVVALIGGGWVWYEARSTGRIQLEDQVVILEKRVDDENAILARFQDQTIVSSNQIATIGARLDGFYAILTVIKEDEERTEQRIIDGNHTRDETTRMQNDALNRRLDTLQQQILALGIRPDGSGHQ
jgi:hypothetical protein